MICCQKRALCHYRKQQQFYVSRALWRSTKVLLMMSRRALWIPISTAKIEELIDQA
ncbi:hypothetical protein [Dubosiella newyorkensis]|uniref:hypothetical protein n=1 Tax=Dubosiella newyorkensis TaxID=1862672 RepID=UPI003F662B87